MRGVITINEGTTFLICDDRGDVVAGAEHGLYFQDTRFLCEYTLRVDGTGARVLGAQAVAHDRAVHFLTNPGLDARTRGRLSLVRRRSLRSGMYEDIAVTNYADETCEIELSFDFGADFSHIFIVKHELAAAAAEEEALGSLDYRIDPAGRSIWFGRSQGDARRELTIALTRPAQWHERTARYRLTLAPRERWDLALDFSPRDVRPPDGLAAAVERRLPPPVHHGDQRERHAAHVARAPALKTRSFVLRTAYEQSVRDFSALRIKGEDISRGEFVIAAGIPWFMALFGRDSLVASYQSLNFYPEVAEGSLLGLAARQGTTVDPLRQEEPGKILHEHRHSPPTGPGPIIPAFPYYGSVDATPLFLVVLAAHLRATGDRSLVERLRENAERAVSWMDNYGERDGYLVYEADRRGLRNQGWKDSADAVRFRDGRIARGSIALCEVQGYAYAARLGMAELYEALGESEFARAQRAKAEALQQRFEEDFWIEERGFYAEALDGERRPVDALTSNAGQLLWTGIVAPERARRVADVLLSREFFSGWGIRTMATSEAAYNPISYHNGTVWPHDNGLIMAGLLRYGFVAEARTIADALLAALAASPDRRLPELFAGFGRDDAIEPVEYPTACRPQAWAAGTVFLLLAACAGFDPMPGAASEGTAAFLPTDVDRLVLEGVWARGKRGRVDLTRHGSKTEREVS